MALLCGTALLLAALAVNLRVLDFGFLYLRDDDVNVTLNPHMGGIEVARLKWMFTDWSYVRRYIPLGWLNFSLTYEFAGLNPRPYHAVALALYGINVALVFAITLLALRLFAPADRGVGLTPWDVGSAALAAGWWALHPLRVETTAWISGNLYGQSMALFLASLAAYLRTYATAGRRRVAWLCLSGAAYAASLLTYPLALGTPFLLVGLDWLRSRSRPGMFGRLLAEKIVFLVPLCGMLAVTLAARFANTEVFGAVPGMRDLPLGSRIAQSAYVAAYYLWKPWWPTHLSPLYDTLFEFDPWGAPFLLSMAAVAAVSAFAVLRFRRHPTLAVLWFGYLAVAAPFFGLTEKPHMASDRYSYFLTVITAAVLAAGLSRLSTPRARAVASVASLGIIGCLGRLSWRQLDVWSDDRTQHIYVASGITNPVLLEDFRSRQVILEFIRGNEKAAAEIIATHLRADPTSQGFLRANAIMADKKRIGAFYGPVSYLAILHDRLALRCAELGELRESNDHFNEALRLNPHFYQAAYDQALVLVRMGKCGAALESYLWSASWDPSGLPAAQKRAFLERLEWVSRANGQPLLASAAKAARER
jgi:protein O-mannosyl-transferase